MTADLPADQEAHLLLTRAQEETVITALRTSEEDYAAGRWISLEEYEAQTLARRQARDATKDKQ